MFSAVKSPMLLMKKTSSPLVINESFFLDFIKGFSVSKFHNSFPLIIEKHLIVLFKSIIINLLSETFILELKPVFVSTDFMRFPFFKSIKKILEILVLISFLFLYNDSLSKFLLNHY